MVCTPNGSQDDEWLAPNGTTLKNKLEVREASIFSRGVYSDLVHCSPPGVSAGARERFIDRRTSSRYNSRGFRGRERAIYRQMDFVEVQQAVGLTRGIQLSSWTLFSFNNSPHM